MQNNQESRKLVLVGPSGVGKTHLAATISRGAVAQAPLPPTVGVEIRPLKFGGRWWSAWDIAGRPEYKGLGTGYLLGAEAIVGCYRDAQDLALLCTASDDGYIDLARAVLGSGAPVILARLIRDPHEGEELLDTEMCGQITAHITINSNTGLGIPDLADALNSL